MKLRQLVLEKAIVTGMKSPKRDECIGELLDALMKGGAFKPAHRDDFLKAVIKREKRVDRIWARSLGAACQNIGS